MIFAVIITNSFDILHAIQHFYIFCGNTIFIITTRTLRTLNITGANVIYLFRMYKTVHPFLKHHSEYTCINTILPLYSEHILIIKHIHKIMVVEMY